MKTTTLLLSSLFPFLAVACCPTSQPPPTLPPPAPPQQVASQDVSRLVTSLVETGEVTSAGVGYGGTKSASYAAYEALAKAATLDELRALLSHDSPIVRAYVAAHLAQHDASSLPQLASMLTDASPIQAQYGCMRTPTTVASHVANELCYVRNYDANHSTEAEALLQTAAQNPSSPAHADAAHCLSRPVPTARN